jgi:hypothetical protein
MVRPLYNCRVEGLGPDDRVVVECACGHLEHLSAVMLATAGLPLYTKVLDLINRRSFTHVLRRFYKLLTLLS